MADARARFLRFDAADTLANPIHPPAHAPGYAASPVAARSEEQEAPPTPASPRRRKWRRAASVGEDEAGEDTQKTKEDEDEEEEEAFDHVRLLGLGGTRATADETAFGLPRAAPESAQRKSSLQMIAAAAREMRRVSVHGLADPDRAARVARVAERWHTVGFALLLLDAVYVLLAVPLRVGFFFDPWAHRTSRNEWTKALTVFTTFDVLGELTRVVFVSRLVLERRKQSASAEQATGSASTSPAATAGQPNTASRPTRKSFFSIRDSVSTVRVPVTSSEALPVKTRANSVNTTNAGTIPLVALVTGTIPIELVIVVIDCNWLHLACVTKWLAIWFSLAPSYSALLLKCRRFRWVQWLSFTTLALPFYLFWLGLYLCHLSACGFMLIANVECGLDAQYCSRTPIPGSWIIKDKLERATMWRRYLRALYWASETITTLGQGDLVPATLAETMYAIAIQFISGLWATAFLASCCFYFSRRDRDIDNGVSTRLEQALRFLKSRKVPSTLARQIRHYYQHIQRTRNGIEEDQVLSNLPAHYRTQCSFFVKYRLLAKISFFTEQPKAFLRSVVDTIESDFLSPKQTVLAMFEAVELIIVARGDISVLDQSKACVRILSQEEWFGEEALFEDSRSKFELEARSFCEVMRLSREQFQVCMERHFPRVKIAAMMDQQTRRVAIIPSTDARLKHVSNPGGYAQGRVSGRSTILFILQQALGIADDRKGVPWHHPRSKFRMRWRLWKVGLLLFVAFEVPFEIAFEWRVGFFGATGTTYHQLLYIVVGLVEIFFYVDWYFRACVFARARVRSSVALRDSTCEINRPKVGEPSGLETAPTVAVDEMTTKPWHLLELYLLRSTLWIDIVANVPIASVWNFINRSSYGVITQEVMRWTRVLALCRLTVLKQTLKKIMVERDFSPALQLLVNVVVFCAITANVMACYFYLLADDKDFYNALPVGFDPVLTPVGLTECLEIATLTSNCTWFMFDRSKYAIQARYLRSLHWSLVVLSSVVYGDIVPFTNSECLLVLCWIYLGTFICYFTSCAVGSVVSQITVLRSAQAARVEAVTRALVRMDVSSATRILIRSHYEANWEMNGSTFPEQCMMENLPQSLRHQLSSSLYVPGIRQCYVFSCLGGQAAMLREMALLMSSEMFLPKVVIVENGHLASGICIVLSGEVELLLPYDSGQHGSTRQRSLLVTRNNSTRSLTGFYKRIKTWLTRHHRSSSLQKRRSVNQQPLGIPIAALKEGDCFGEEGLLPDYRSAMRVTARTLTGTQIAVLRRDSFMGLAGRFPVQVRQIVTLITKKQEADSILFETIRANFKSRPKALEFMGMTRSLYCETKPQVNNIITTDTYRYRVWRIMHAIVIIYNFYVITFRLAFLPGASKRTILALTVVDYITDAFLYIDIYLKWNRFGYEEYGDQIVDLVAIRRRYKKGWLRVDMWSMLPLYYYGDFFTMSAARLPRMLKSLQIFENLDAVEALIREEFMKGSTTMLSVFDLFKFLLYFLSAAHHVGSIYFLIGRLLTENKLVRSSWMTVDVAITASPGDILVQYNRAIYWCLETFTVVCFGDIISQNAGETVFAFCTCIVGWMCIGQVVGRITSLMANIDKDTTEHNARVDKFEKFAQETDLPQFLRERAIESAEYKSKSLIELNLRSTFEDLPPALHAALFEEMYGAYIRGVPEFLEVMKPAQLRVLADALVFRIYVTDDIILEEGRLGSALYIMKEGRAEYFSARSMIVFAAIYEGQLFGDTAFFVPDARYLSSVRASRSCQVLEVERRKWNEIWDEQSRRALKEKFAVSARLKLASMKLAHANIIRNFDETHAHTTDGEARKLDDSNFVHESIESESENSDHHDSMVPNGSPNLYRSNLQGYTTLLWTIRSLLRLRVARKVSPVIKYEAHLRQSIKASTMSDESRLAQKLRRSLGINAMGTMMLRSKSAPPGMGTDPQNTSSYLQHLDTMKSRFQRRQDQTMFNLHQLTAKPVTNITGGTTSDIWVDPPLPASFCLEHSKFRQVWSTVMFFICLYFVHITPFQVSFNYEFLSNEKNQAKVRGWFLIEYVMDLLCIVDFVLNKNYFTFVNHGTLVTDKHEIRNHYLREGTYVMDLFGILPFEILLPFLPLENAPGTNTKVTWYRVAVFRLNKMVRIAHLRGLGEKLQRMLIYDAKVPFARPSVIYFLRLALDFVLGAHWLACLFYGATFNQLKEGTRSWLTTAGMLTFDGREGTASTVMKYTRSLYFSMGTVTTVTYGDIAPQNAWETFVTTFVIITSIVLFGMLSGGFSRMFEMELGQQADYEEKIASVAHFMMFHQFPSRVWKHMQSYFMVYWSESQGMNEDELLDGLPLSVKNDITLYVKQDFIKQMRLFAGCDEAFVRAVVAAFDRELFVTNDVIITYGDRSRSLYVIESGSVVVRVPQNPLITGDDAAMSIHAPQSTSAVPDLEIIKGRFDFFGEQSLIFDIPRSATCVALSACRMLILTVDKYDAIIESFPEYRQKHMNEWVIAKPHDGKKQSLQSLRRPPAASGRRTGAPVLRPRASA